MAEGTIKKLTDKGFGFIKVANGKDLFFHCKSVQGTPFDELREGQAWNSPKATAPRVLVPRTSKCSKLSHDFTTAA